MKKIKLKVSSVIAKSAIFRNGAGSHRDHKEYAKNYRGRERVVNEELEDADVDDSVMPHDVDCDDCNN